MKVTLLLAATMVSILLTGCREEKSLTKCGTEIYVPKNELEQNILSHTQEQLRKYCQLENSVCTFTISKTDHGELVVRTDIAGFSSELNGCYQADDSVVEYFYDLNGNFLRKWVGGS